MVRTQSTRAGVEVTGGCRAGRCEQGSVDDGRQALNACCLDSNDEGRSRRGRIEVETLAVRRHEQTDDDDTPNVEEENTDVDPLDSLREVAPRVLCLAGGDLKEWIRSSSDLLVSKRRSYRHNLRADEREGSLSHDRPPAKEATSGSRNVVVLHEGARMLPVSETDAVVVRSTAQIKYDTEDDETDDGDNLYGCEDKLRLAIHAGSEQVNHDDDNQEYGYPRCAVDCAVPETDEDSCSAELGGENDRPVIPCTKFSMERSCTSKKWCLQ